MANKNNAITQKIDAERNKQVWILKNKEGKLIDSFRSKYVAIEEKRKLELLNFEGLILERDTSIRENLVNL